MNITIIPDERSEVDEALMFLLRIHCATPYDIAACYGRVGWDFLAVFGLTRSYMRMLQDR